MPGARQYDAKSGAFYTLADTNQLRFTTSRGQSVNAGVGLNSSYCGGGDGGDCSTSGNWADSSLSTNVWAR